MSWSPVQVEVRVSPPLTLCGANYSQEVPAGSPLTSVRKALWTTTINLPNGPLKVGVAPLWCHPLEVPPPSVESPPGGVAPWWWSFGVCTEPEVETTINTNSDLKRDEPPDLGCFKGVGRSSQEPTENVLELLLTGRRRSRHIAVIHLIQNKHQPG